MSYALFVASARSWVAYGTAAQEAPVSFCGRVVDVSCTSPSSAVTLVLADPPVNSNRRVVIPAEHRHLFGARIEARYDQQLVCVPAAPASASELALVTHPSELVVKGVPVAPIALPDDVARTCDQDVRLPIVTRDVKPQYTADAMRAKVHGSVFLRGVVDRTGTVRDVRVVQSLEPSLDAAAHEAFAQWRFRPATRGGEPVSIAISVQMAFTMR
jgi:TonB family protein